MKPRTIEQLAQELGITDKRLEGLRRQYRLEHGEDAEAKLERRLRSTWEASRDKVRLMGRQGGYVENFAGALQVRGPDGETEPEAVPEHVQAEYSRTSWETFELVKGEELVKRQARVRAERLRQAEIELRQCGKSHEQYAQAVDAAIEAMKAEAKAA